MWHIRMVERVARVVTSMAPRRRIKNETLNEILRQGPVVDNTLGRIKFRAAVFTYIFGRPFFCFFILV